MNLRLLSFLSFIENAIQADDPSPSDGGTWQATRMANYDLGLARLALSVRLPGGGTENRGTIGLQNYSLADGTLCLRVELGWPGREAAKTLFIYSKPGTDWLRESRKAAAEWMAGPPAQAEAGVYDGALSSEPAAMAG